MPNRKLDARSTPRVPAPLDRRAEFTQRDRGHDGALSRSESGLTKQAFQAADFDGDGALSAQEYAESRFQAGTFKALDGDRTASLDAAEMAHLERATTDPYDKDGDGKVSRDEFFTAHRAETNANREALWRTHFASLGASERRKVGKALRKKPSELTADDYVQYRRSAARQAWSTRVDDLMTKAGGRPSGLDLKSTIAKRYAGYDADHDGRVSKAEFAKGAEKDRVAAMRSRMLTGTVADAGLRARLGVDARGRKLALTNGKPALKLPTPAPKPRRQTPDARPVAGADHHANRTSWFISQYPSKWNPKETATHGNSNCGPTSLTMVAKAFGVIHPSAAEANAAIDRTRRKMGVRVSDYAGSSYPDIARGARAYGLDAAIAHGKPGHTADKAAAELAKGRLVIANVMPTYMFRGIGSGHYTVVTKVDKTHVYLNDPANRHGPMRISRQAFERAVSTKGTYALVSVGSKK